MTAYRTTANTGTSSFVWNGRLAALPASSLSDDPVGTGAYRWVKPAGGTTGTVAGYGTAVDASGNIYVAGAFWGSANFGGGPLTSVGSADVYLAKFSPTGEPVWSKRFGGTLEDMAYAVTVDKSGNVIIAGSYMDRIDFGGGALVALGSSYGREIFVAQFSSAGDHIWSKSFGGAGNDMAYGLATDTSGNVIVTGSYEGKALFGATMLTSSYSSTDVFLVKLTSAGAIAFAKGFGGSGIDSGGSVAVDAAGNIFLVGSFMGPVNFGGGVLQGVGISDIFVAKFTSAGAHTWSRQIGGTGDDAGFGIAVDGSGGVVVTGTSKATSTLAAG